MKSDSRIIKHHSIIMAIIAANIALIVLFGGNPWLLIAVYWLGVAGYWACKDAS